MRAQEHPADRKKGMTGKRIAAICAIVLLVGMYVVTLIAAILDAPGSGRLFRLCLGLTAIVPIFTWICIWAVGRLTGRHTIASVDVLQSDPEERRRMEEAVRREQESQRSSEKTD